MARYDQGGGCACGLRRYCDCGSGQADGSKIPRVNPLVEAFQKGLPERQRRHAAAIKELGRDPKITTTSRIDPRTRGRARRNKHETEKSQRRIAELDEQSRIRKEYEAWQLKRHVTAFDRNPVGTWGDEGGEKYAAPFVQAAWEAWDARQMNHKPMPFYGVARLYCDMDGVAADFDRHYRNLFGRTRERHTNWDDVRSIDHFFLGIPVMRDWPMLWAFIKPYSPIFLTGTPTSVNPAGNDKMTWIAQNVGAEVPVICCKARRKALFCRPGDVLIDDSEEHRGLWENAGGIWVTHKSAADTIEMLQSKGFC